MRGKRCATVYQTARVKSKRLLGEPGIFFQINAQEVHIEVYVLTIFFKGAKTKTSCATQN